MYGDPDQLDRLARQLRLRAGEVRAEGDRHLRQGQAAHWVSSSADAYRDRIARTRTRTEEAADSMDAAADVLVRHAQQVRETLAAIAEAERRVVGWLDDRWHQAQRLATGVVDGVERIVRQVDPWAGLPFDPMRLPQSGDAGWLDVQRKLSGWGGS